MNVRGHEGWKVKPAQLAVHGHPSETVGSRKVILGELSSA